MQNITRDATEIRTTIRHAENLMDELMVTLSALRIKILNARSNPVFDPHEGQKALIRLQRAEQQLLEGSSNIFRTHDELSSIAVRMDVEHPTKPSGLSPDEVVVTAMVDA